MINSYVFFSIIGEFEVSENDILRIPLFISKPS